MYEVPASPRTETYLAVDAIHQLYIYEYGNPDGIPALFCHGGPGAGSQPKHARYFDPKYYRIILFDQRGAGKSKPCGSLENNNTQALIEDMEKIRQTLKIDKWVLFGGSWGTTLALLYAEAYPQHVLGLALRGVFLSREEDCTIFYRENSPAALCHPKEWGVFKKNLNVLSLTQNLTSQDHHINNLFALLNSKEINVAKRAAEILSKWEEKICMLNPPQPSPNAIPDADPMPMINAARIEVAYTKNNCYLSKNQILENIHKLANIPVFIIQGSVDLVCPQYQAFALFNALQKISCDVKYTEAPAGHSGDEPTLIDPIIEALDTLALKLRLAIDVNYTRPRP